MTYFFAVIALTAVCVLIGFIVKSRKLEQEAAAKNVEVAKLQEGFNNLQEKVQRDAQEALARGEELVKRELERQQGEAERTRLHYQAEARRVQIEAETITRSLREQLDSLKSLKDIAGGEEEARRILEAALAEAAALRDEAKAFLAKAREVGAAEREAAISKAKDLRQNAESLLAKATRDAASIISSAHKKAENIAGDAYTALREKDRLERATIALQNVVDGYGDRYIVPTRSLLDELAADFGHMEAGQALASAREHSRRMVVEGLAAECDYVEVQRKETAIRFVIDAFNGRVDAILSRTKHDNFGTLEQEIRDAFALVNLNGKAFRDARIVDEYLNARLSELKWAVVAQEMRLKEREEQRRIKEQIREEEKARREYERAMQEAQREEEILTKALEKAKAEAAHATNEQRAKFEEQIAVLNAKLIQAEEKNQRAISMAQQTRKGNVYIISNVGSFGEDIYKIGMTRRLEPYDRIKELGDASVPFSFDVHAMIPSDDAPALENLLHTHFDELRINQVNYRKEFFRVPLDRVRQILAEKGMNASFTMLADAKEYRESARLRQMTPEERERYWHQQEAAEEDGIPSLQTVRGRQEADLEKEVEA